MELEFKYIAPYLPYGLNFRISEGKIFPLNANHIFNNHTGQYKGLERGAKIILRPLSDLTKEIEVGGNRFVPVEKMYNGTINSWKNNQETCGIWYDYIMELHDHDLIKELQYSDILFLLEWHFDVFGLIEQGLAIDINKIYE